MKTLSLLMPTYNATEHLERNFEMWKQLSQVVELIFVEDTKEEKSREIIKKIGGRYYSKSNGNWGSVVNFAKKNRLIETEYMAVIDPDDCINIEELNKLLPLLKGADIYVANQLTTHFIDKWTIIRKSKHNNIFIHYSWFKSNVFYQIDDLPEGVSYTDTLIMQNLLGYSKSIEFVDLIPYIYYVGFPNQSMAIKWEALKKNSEKLKSFSDFSNKVKKSKILWKYQKKSRVSSKYVFHFMLINCYKNETKENRKEIIKAAKYIRWFKRPIETWMIWLRIHIWGKNIFR